MIANTVFLSLLVFNWAMATMVPSECPQLYEGFAGRCWKYESTKKTWQDADNTCFDANDPSAHMADPRSLAESQFVSSKFCNDNDAIGPSPWNVWTGDTSYHMYTVPSPPPSPITDSSYRWRTPTINQNILPKWICVCTPPTNPPSSQNWCIDVESSRANSVAGLTISNSGDIQCVPTPSKSPTSCSGSSGSLVRRLCRSPDIPHAIPSNTGRGACWLAASRGSGGGTMRWTEGTQTTSFAIDYNRFEPNLKIMADSASRSQFALYQTTGYSGSTRGGPDCSVMWSFNNGTWVSDQCNGLYPFVCVRDATCKPGYAKTTPYTATPTSYNPGVCTLCPGGQYRSAIDEETTCLPCSAGYFGNGTTPRNSTSCSGVCPSGFFCPQGTTDPSPCLPGTFGNPLSNPTFGPGWNSSALGCSPCPPGKYCPLPNMTTNLPDVDALFCSSSGETTPRGSSQCPQGYYCPGGTACPGHPCGDGALPGKPSGSNAYCPMGSKEPKPVSTGFYGSGNSSLFQDSEIECSPGFYCVNGTRIPCPEGTYSNIQIPAAERYACKPCASGYRCAAPVSPTTASSTSPFQDFCANVTDEDAAEHYCIQGVHYRLPVNDSTMMTVPQNGPRHQRENAVPCPNDKVCFRGLASDRLVWGSVCPGGVRSVKVPELWSQQDTNHTINATMFHSLLPADWNLDYRILGQSFYDVSKLEGSKCVNGITSNDGIFDIDSDTGRLRLKRFSPDPTDPSGALQFEACEPITDIRYSLSVQASLRHKTLPIQANITCAVTVIVTDENDQPVFDSLEYHRVIPENAVANTAALRCSADDLATAGCPTDDDPDGPPEIPAEDEDSFFEGNLTYSFVGTFTDARGKLTINSCTGRISQKGGAGNVIRFSDPDIPWYNEDFKRLNFTVRAEDDGNSGAFSPRFMETLVFVYIRNVNDRPVFNNVSADIWIPESTSSHRFPAGTRTTPATLDVSDDDPKDTVTLTIVKNDAAAFEIVGGELRTTVDGESVINYESSKKIYTIDIEARDDGSPSLASMITVNIRVANMNDPPIIENNLIFYIVESAKAGDPVCRDDSGICTADNAHSIRVSDPDNIPGDKTTFALTLNPNGLFAIDPNSGQVSLVSNNSLDFEDESTFVLVGTGRAYTLQVMASSDGFGVVTQPGLPTIIESSIKNFTVYIVDVNEDPVFSTPNYTAFRVVETWPVGTVVSTISIQASDPDNEDVLLLGVAAPKDLLTFSLSPVVTDGSEFFVVTTDPNDNTKARVMLRKALDFETAPDCGGGTKCYHLQIRLTDNGAPQGVAEGVFVINLIDVNEAPFFTQPSFTIDAREDYTYALAVDVPSGVTLTATDPDTVTSLSYSLISGDGFSAFNVATLAPPPGFKVFKRANVLLNYEQKQQFTLQVRVTDNSGGSSAIGKACILDQGVSIGCGAGAFCQNSQCYETCRSYQNATTTIAAGSVPRVDLFFCQDLTGVNGLVALTPPFRETADVTVLIKLSNENDPPFIIDRPETNPLPTLLTNPTCNLTSVVNFGAIATLKQFPFSSILVYDEDAPNPGPRAGPFSFSIIDGPFWDTFKLNNSVTGRVELPRCLSSCTFAVDQVYSGQISVTDQGAMSSVCNLFVRIIDNNAVPDFGGDFDIAEVSELAEPDTVIQRGYTFDELLAIDSNLLDLVPDSLTFSTSFSAFFYVDPLTAEIALRRSLDFESLAPTFVQTILIRVVDSKGASDVVQVTIPVKDENEAPFWTVQSLSAQVYENASGLTVLQDLVPLVKDPDRFAQTPAWNVTEISLVPNTGCEGSCPVEVVGGILRIKATPNLDFETKPSSWTFVLRVQDGGGLFAEILATVSLLNVNEEPEFTGTTSIGVPEGAGGVDGRDLIDMSLFVRDPDADDPSSSLTFDITGGNIGNVFRVHGGMLQVAPLAELDYENIRSYVLDVSVSDTKGLGSSGSFTVYINNVNDVTVSTISIISGPFVGSQLLACDGTTSRVQITGTNFGLLNNAAQTQVTLRYRRSIGSGMPAAPVFNTTACSVTVNGTQIECDVSAGGSGLSLTWDVLIYVPDTQIVNDGVFSKSTSISFPAPNLTSVAGADLMSTAGGQNITLSGTCLGVPADQLTFGESNVDSFVEMCTLYDAKCRVMPTNCLATSTTGSTVTCTFASLTGLGASTSFKVRSARQISNTLIQGSYAPPAITSLSLTTLRSSGAITAPGLVINGTNFSGQGSPSRARLYYNASGTIVIYNLLGCTVTDPFRQVTCTSHSPGIGRDIRLELEFGLQTNPTSPLLNFEIATVTSIATDGNSLSPSTGGVLVTLTGTSFGPTCGVPGTSSTSGAVNCGLISATYSRGSPSVVTGQPIVYKPHFCAVTSQSQIICTMVEGTGRNHTWTLTVGGQPALGASNAGKTGYSSPVVGGYDGAGSTNALTQGSQIIDIVGAHFGPIGGANISAVYGNEQNPTEFRAVNCSVTIPHIQIRCFTGVGAGNSLSWKVTVDGQESRAQLSDYGPPVITSVTLAGLPSTSLSDDGGQVVVLTGNNYGPPGSTSYLQSVTYGPVLAQSLYDATAGCTVVTHETLQCTTVPGLGSNLVWRVRVRGQSSVSSSAQSSYSSPMLISMSTNTSKTNGGTVVRLLGRFFGFCDSNALVQVVFGNLLVDIKNVYLPGAVDPIIFATACGVTLPLAGADRLIEFVVPEMIASNRIPVSVQVDPGVFPSGTYRTSQSFMFEYGTPEVSDVYAEPGQVIGQIVVTLSGSNFCRSEACCQTYLNGQLHSNFVIIHTHDRITFTTNGPGTAFVRCPGGDTDVQVFSSQNPFVYGVVRASDFARIDTVSFSTAGGEEIFIFSLFATVTATVTIGGRPATVADVATFPCEETAAGFRPDTIDSVHSILVPNQVCARIRTVVPPGQGRNNDIVVTVGSLRSRSDDFRFEFLSYSVPSITQLSANFASSYSTQGDPTTILTIIGTNFGLSGEILFGPLSFATSRNKISCNSASPGTIWGHNNVSCTVPAGEGSSLDIRLTSGGQTSPAATQGKLKYSRPVITNVTVAGTSDNLANTIGGQTLIVSGSNFGRFFNASAIATSPGQLPVVTLGSTLNCAIQYSTHTEIRCVIPPADGRNLAVSVIVASEPPATVSPILFSYGPPEITSITPSTGRTDGLNDQGTRQVLEIVGKNFGVDTLKVEFGTVNGPVLLGERSSRNNNVNTFIYPGTNHTVIRVYLPSYFGANLNVTVTVNGQVSSPNGPKFSYHPPFIGNATVSRGGRSLADDSVHVDNQAWTTGGQYGPCMPLRNQDPTTANVAVTMVYKSLLDVDSAGNFTRVYRFYSVSEFATITNVTCQNGDAFLGESIQTGSFVDFGEHPGVGCLRAYQANVATVTGFQMPGQLFPTGGFGFYLVSERKYLYLSAPSFASLENLLAAPAEGDFNFEAPSATLLVPPPQVLQKVPTSGCFAWESESNYTDRVNAEFSLTGLANLPRQCLAPALISLTGGNFGSGVNAPQGALRVFLVDDRGVEYEASTTSSGGNHELTCPTELGCLHTNGLIIFQAPFGSGRGLRVRVVLGNQENISLPMVDYEGPTLDEVMPGTLNSGASFMAPSGNETIRVIGENLGFSTSSLAVLVNGRPCTNTTWITGYTERLGRSSIQCVAPNDVAGLKSVFVCVGAQGRIVTPIDPPDDIAALQYGTQEGSWNTTTAPNINAAKTVRALAVAKCPTGYFGRIGELCLPCPIGGRCDPGFVNPVPISTFALITMASDSKRALEGSCNKERIDKSLSKTFPDIVFYETCQQMVRCVPHEACLADGQCAEGYEYQLHRCRAKRADNSSDLPNSCRVFFDSAVGVYRGVHSDCRHSTEPNKVCTFENPEDCSDCVVHFASPDPTSAFGTCECTQPQRCALCSAGTHYRLNNECVKCPDNPALVFSLFILAGILCIALAYYLQKRKINLAFISVGVDYFQVLAVLSTTSVPWPPVIRQIFTIFSLFLASIDIAAPECLVPNLEFPTKFYMTELLPALALLILLSIHFGYSAFKVYKLGKQAKWLSHVSRLVGIFVLILYVLYLSLTKKALDVFNCNPLDPDDGYAYTAFSSLSCDGGGLCRCYDEGGLQDSLVAPAIIFLIIYTFGFPAYVAYVVFRHREQIQEDQYLRANRLGERRETNPRSYDIRKRYQLMYMHFKPRYSFWMLAILGRKFGVAFASLMFRGNPSFQLAVILVVLFVSFTLQVSIRPYMSPGEFPVVVKELNDRSKKADEDLDFAPYRDLYRKVSECMKTQAELLRKEKMQRHKMGAGFWEESRQAAREHDRRSVAEKYFFDLNAVEAVLLGSTIIISLAGIMFESGRFQTTRSDIAWQGDLVIVLVFFVLFGSLVYYALVFINEMWPVFFARWCGRCFLRYQNDGITNDEIEKIKDNDIVLDANPLFAATGPVGDKSKSLQKEIESSKEALALAKRQNEELKRLKTELESSGTMTAQNPLALRELMNTGGLNEKS